MNSAIAANAEARESLPSPVSPLTPSSLRHEARDNYSSIASDGPGPRERVDTAQVLPNPSAQSNTAHGPAHHGSGFGESLSEGGPVEDQTTRASPPQNVPGPGDTIAVVQSAGERHFPRFHKLQPELMSPSSRRACFEPAT